MRNWHGNLSPFGKWHTAGGRLNPFASLMSTLLADATQLIAHPLEYGSMFQDRAGTTPVTEPGQLVGMVLDHGFTGSKPVFGPELVTNGTFDADFTGWISNEANPEDMTTTVSGGEGTVTNINAVFGFVSQVITTQIGKVYTFSIDLTASNEGNFLCRVGTAVGASNLLNFDGFGTLGTRKGTFTATTTETFVSFGNSSSAAGNFKTVDNVSVRELPGYHATAISDAARGVYAVVPETGRRNLTTYSQDFTDASWVTTQDDLTLGETSPTGAADAYLVSPTTTTVAGIIKSFTLTSAPYTLSSYLKAGTGTWVRIAYDTAASNCAWFNLSSGTIGTVNGSGAEIEDIGGGWYRCSLLIGTASADAKNALIGGVSGDNLKSRTIGQTYSIYGAQLEEGSTTTAYQKVVSEFDVTEAGVPSLPYLASNGVNTAYATPALPAPLVDKAQVFAGVRKLSDAGTAIVVEAATGTENGTLSIRGPSDSAVNAYAFKSKGTSETSAQTPLSNFPAPTTNVIIGLGDISGDLATLRVDGTQVAQNTADQGTGNYNPSGTYPLYYGARGGTSLFFNGRHYATLGPITRFSAANATAAQIEAAEAYYTARVI